MPVVTFRTGYIYFATLTIPDILGVLKIINTDITNVDIYMEKAWENQPDPMPEIELELKRKKTGYSGSQKTSVKVNMLDEAGNLITSYVTHDVYAGGSAELPYYWPDGVELYHYEGMVLDENTPFDTAYPDSYPKKAPDSLGVKFMQVVVGFLV